VNEPSPSCHLAFETWNSPRPASHAPTRTPSQTRPAPPEDEQADTEA
jgi:hypothetical protein